MDSFGVDDIFLLTVGLIFALTLLGAFLRRITHDRCLRLLHDHHVTYLPHAGRVVWGDLHVSSHGLEIRFDSSFVNSRGLTKSGYFVYEDELLESVAICRTVHGLTPAEAGDRERQIKRTVHPRLHRRVRRSMANLLNIVRDAVVNTLGLFVGRMDGKANVGAALQTQTGQIKELGGAVLGLVTNAYEPLLERYLGKRVVLDLTFPQGAPHGNSEFSGYLVEYNEKFIALFNPVHAAKEKIDARLEETTELAGCTVEISSEKLSVVCTGKDAIVLKSLELGEEIMDVGAVLLTGQSLSFHRQAVGSVRLVAERTRQLDIICPRARARVRFSGTGEVAHRQGWTGIAPDVEGGEAP